MKKHNLAFIDLETTGLETENHEIIEIGCILARQKDRVGKGPEIEKIDEFEIKVKPKHIETADPEALRINGYVEGDWVFASSLEDAMKVISEKTKDAIMVGHNVSFDIAFLEKAFEEVDVPNLMHYHKIDTLPIAFSQLYDDNEVTRFGLINLCKHLGIEHDNAHTALSDIRATYDLYKKLLNA